MKKRLAILLCLVFTLSSLVSGCGKINDTSKSSSSDKVGVSSADTAATTSGEKVVLNYMCLSDWTDRLEKINQEFTKANPNIEVNLESYPFDQLFQVIEVKLGAGDNHFDLIATDVPMISGYGYRDYYQPLDEYFTKEDKDKLVSSAVEAGTYKGKLLGVPMNSSSQLLFYNKDLLQKAGVEIPSEDVNSRWTWEKITDASKTIMGKLNADGKTGIWGLTFDQISRPYQILALPNSLGKKGIGDDGVTVDGILNSPEWIKAMQWYSDIHNTLKISPKGSKPAESRELFKSGKCAFFVGGPWNIGPISENKDLKWGYAPHPYFEGGKAATSTGSWYFGVNKNSKHAKEAAEYSKYFSIGAGSDIWFAAEGNVPATKALINAIIEDKDGKYKQFPNSAYKITAYEALNTAVPRPLTPGYGEWENTVGATMEDIRNGAEPKAALDAAVAKLKPALDKYKK